MARGLYAAKVKSARRFNPRFLPCHTSSDLQGRRVCVIIWEHCLKRLEGALTAQQFNTWVRPLQVQEEGETLRLLAPNRFVLEWIKDRYFDLIQSAVVETGNDAIKISLEIGSKKPLAPKPAPAPTAPLTAFKLNRANEQTTVYVSNINGEFSFANFIEGKSNQLARAAASQVAEHAGCTYNPLFIYGGVGLGKTHLMQAIGNAFLTRKTDARVIYIHSERFVGDMVKALQHNAIEEFKRYYRGVDMLLIDDIQFFAGKERSQEEFFHTFNSLMERRQQIIMTCDRYPKEIEGLEERLKSRFGWGLTVPIEPPELETRVAILKSKARLTHHTLPDEVAFFIAKRVRSNVRELEGALRRVIANARFTGKAITLDFAKEALRDLINSQDKFITIDNIQKVVAEYYKIRISDLVSQRRSRSIARPRQMAMTLSKDLTKHSLPEIGAAFGGRDHTTVLHACKKIASLRQEDRAVGEDYSNLLRTLTT